jgi:uncharacterized protein YcbX
MNQPMVTGLYVYPVKSMKGIAQEQAILTPKGLRHDRIWMVVRPDGRFVTQRDLPRLALVNTQLEADAMVLSMEGHGSIALPFDRSGGTAVVTRVWRDECRTADEGPRVARWLTRAMDSEQELRIVRMAAGFTRPQSQPQRFGSDTTTHFADSAPYLVANQASLNELNRELQTQGQAAVPMDRFRPNIVVDGLEPFGEHHVASLSGAGWRLAMADRCERCLVTTIDQQTAQRNPAREPFMTLRRINPMPGPKPAPAFAHHAVLDSGDGQQIHTAASIRVEAQKGSRTGRPVQRETP